MDIESVILVSSLVCSFVSSLSLYSAFSPSTLWASEVSQSLWPFSNKKGPISLFLSFL